MSESLPFPPQVPNSQENSTPSSSVDILKELDIYETISPEKIFLGSLRTLIQGNIENLEALEGYLSDRRMIAVLQEKINGHEDAFNAALNNAYSILSGHLKASQEKGDVSAIVLCEKAMNIIGRVGILTGKGLVTIAEPDDILTPYGGPPRQSTVEALSNANVRLEGEMGLANMYQSFSPERKLLVDNLQVFLNGIQMSAKNLESICAQIAKDKEGDDVRVYLQKQAGFEETLLKLGESIESEQTDDTVIPWKRSILGFLGEKEINPTDFPETQTHDDVHDFPETQTFPDSEVVVEQLQVSAIQLTLEQRVNSIKNVLEPLFQSGEVLPNSLTIRIALTQPNNREALESLNSSNDFITKIITYIQGLSEAGKENIGMDDSAIVTYIKTAFRNSRLQDAINQFVNGEKSPHIGGTEVIQSVLVPTESGSVSIDELPPIPPTIGEGSGINVDRLMPGQITPISALPTVIDFSPLDISLKTATTSLETNSFMVGKTLFYLFHGNATEILKNSEQMKLIFLTKESEVQESVMSNPTYLDNLVESLDNLKTIFSQDSKEQENLNYIISAVERLVARIHSPEESEKPQDVVTEVEDGTVLLKKKILKGFLQAGKNRLIGGVKAVAEKIKTNIASVRDEIREKISQLKNGKKVENVVNTLWKEKWGRAERPDEARSSEAQKALENIFRNYIKKPLDSYEELPKKTKLLISGSLLALGIVGSALSVGPLVATVGVGRMVLRTVSAGVTAGSAYKFAEARGGGEKTKIAAAITAGITALFMGSLMNHVSGALPYVHEAWVWISEHVISFSSPIPIVANVQGVGTSVPDASSVIFPEESETQGVSSEIQNKVDNGNILQEVQKTAVKTIAPSLESFTILSGDTLSSTLLNNDVLKAIAGEYYDNLSDNGKQNLVANIINQLIDTKPDKLAEFGLDPKNIAHLKIGDTVDLKKIVESVQSMKLPIDGDGNTISLVARALQIR